MLEPLLTPEQAAAILGLSVKRLYGLVRKQKLGCVQVTARSRMFSAEQVEQFIKSRTIEPPKKSVDTRTTKPLPYRQKGGDSRNCGDSAKALREEMRSWR